MATFPLIFPSLSRQPSMDSSKTTEDDTIKDQAESGYVSTRPRFTRARRTWKVNTRNLVLEDIRALDGFFMVTTARGGNSFLYPNVLPNWSFEFPALTAADLVLGWAISSAPAQESIGIGTTTVADGTQAISFGTVATKTIAANTTVSGALNCDQGVSCTPGEVYVFTAALDAIQGTLAAGVLGACVCVYFFAANGNPLSTVNGTAATIGVGWQTYGYQFTVPASAASFRVGLSVTLTNSTASAITLDGSASVIWDEAACALLTPLTPFGRMVGTQPLGCLVRFTKLPEASDIGWGNGVKRYGVNFELTEV
jgi:hypothetical protein